jgi:hypothetical protein
VIGLRHGQRQLFDSFFEGRGDDMAKQFPADPAARVLRLHVHRHDVGLVAAFQAGFAHQAQRADQLAIDERTPKRRVAAGRQAGLRRRDRLRRILLEARREGFRMLAQSAQPELAIRRRVVGDESPDLQIR